MNQVYLKGKPVSVLGKLPQIGTIAPPLQGVDKDLKEKSLADFSGSKKILSFVPSLDTPICSLTAQKLTRSLKDKKNVVLIYYSMDLPFALKRICLTEKNIDSLIAISLFREKDYAKEYGVLVEDGPLRGLCARAVFILDIHNQIQYAEIVEEISKEPSYEEILSFV